MALQLLVDSPGHPRNAQFLAKACELAYLAEGEGAPAYQSELGLKVELVSVDNTQAYLGQNDQHIVVAFRGSESPTSIDGLKDWLLTNAVNYLVPPTGPAGEDFSSAGVDARFHKGFVDSLHEIWPPLLDKVNAAVQAGERPVWITGHSLGGALALLSAWRMNQNFVEVHGVYTFGAPMVGNAAAAQAFQDNFPEKIFRFVDDRDFVPKLPTMSLIANEYQHCLAEVPLGAAASVQSAVKSLQSFAGDAVEGLLNSDLSDRIWARMQETMSSHLMPNYKALISQKCDENA